MIARATVSTGASVSKDAKRIHDLNVEPSLTTLFCDSSRAAAMTCVLIRRSTICKLFL